MISVEDFVKLPQLDAQRVYLELTATGLTVPAEVRREAYWEVNKVSVMMDAPTQEAAARVVGSSQFNWGGLLFGLGLAVALFSFIYDPSVDTQSLGSDGGSFSMPDRIVNNGKLNLQLMLCIFGSALMVSGSVFLSRPRA